jgi:hypothetical protein
MGVATKSRFALVFLMLLSLGLGLSFPAEDIPETPYDESESVPYEVTPLFLIAKPSVAARTTQAPLSSLHLQLSAPSMFLPAPVPDTDASRSTHARSVLTLFCTLHC